MSISKKVKQIIEMIPEGTVISFENFAELPNKRAVALCLSRLKKEGEIERLEKGKYYIPKRTKFGSLAPSESSIVESLLGDGKENYISGVTAYNKLGLTTQISNEITIVGSKYSRKTIIGNIKVKYVKAKAPISRENIFLLQILDALSDIKKIPDTTVNSAIIVIKKKILELSRYKKKEIIKLCQFYRPSVMAIVGVILDEEGIKEVEVLKPLINPLTNFKFNISKDILPLQEKWNLV